MFKKLLLTSALLATFATAHAQSSQNFGVTGTVTPGACNVTLTNGIVNLGTLTQATVKAYAPTAATNVFYTVPTVNVPISIVCGAATKVGVSFIDNKSGKVLPLNFEDVLRFGMTDGSAGTAAIGTYQMSFSSTTIDSVATVVNAFLNATNGTAVWSTKVAGTTTPNNFIAPGYTTTFTKTTGSIIPETFTTLGGNLAIQIFLGKTYMDAATSIVTPNGSGTLTLVYL